MARMHSRRKGKSGSKKPELKKKPIWITLKPKEIESIVLKLAKSGNPASKIGLILRDSYGITDVKLLTGKKITKILEENKLKQELPESFLALLKREIKIQNHLTKNKKDMPSKRSLQLTESKIKRLTKYYKKTGVLPKDWKFDRSRIKLLIS